MRTLQMNHCIRILFFTLVLFGCTMIAAAQQSMNQPSATQLSSTQPSDAEPATAQLTAPDSLPYNQLQDLRGSVTHESVRFQRWWVTWLAGYSAATAAQGAVALAAEDKTVRQDMALGAATTLLGAAGQLISPMFDSKSQLKKSLDEIKADSLQLLSPDQYEELLKSLALREKEGRSWKTHATAFAVNLGSGLITWLGFDRTLKDGLQNFALNTIVTELQIWTQPVSAVKAYQKYSENKSNGETGGPVKPDSELTMSVYPGGFTVNFTF